uniref:Family with sequence similarity 174 member B n=1 Tax=Scleropages formosus TaxID=113540 RepID=A0A8C9VSI3_SCLFO
MCSARAVSCALLALLCEVSCVPHTAPSPVALLTSSSSFLTAEEGEPRGGGGGGTNHSLAVGSRIRSIAKDLPALKNVVICVCALTALLIICLLVKVYYRSGRKIRKTRKYDVITTSAERVEMAPLNDENDDEDDATVFDVKYR